MRIYSRRGYGVNLHREPIFGYGRHMEGFYTKDQAARILGVSTRQVDNYIRAGKLERVKEDRRAWIPKAQVDRLYQNKSLRNVPTLEEVSTLQRQVGQLQKQVKILQRGLGFGGGSPPRNDLELRLLYQRAIDGLAEEGWPITRVMEFTEELNSIREEDMEGLLRLRGPGALRPFFDLARRMVIYVETHDQYPSAGMQAVRDRLMRARRILLALVEVTLRIEAPVITDAVRELYRDLTARPDFIADHVGRYIARMP